MNRRLLLAICAMAMTGLAAPASSAPSSNPADMQAGQYELDKNHASVLAKVSHFGLSTYVFRFDRFDASFSYSPQQPTASRVNVSIDLNSMNTGYEKADKEFPPQFLGTDKSPTATFASTKITRDGNRGVMTGDLTLNGVTKPVTLDVVFNGYESTGPQAGKAGFHATGALKRSDFGLGKYAPLVGDQVELEINVEFRRK